MWLFEVDVSSVDLESPKTDLPVPAFPAKLRLPIFYDPGQFIEDHPPINPHSGLEFQQSQGFPVLMLYHFIGVFLIIALTIFQIRAPGTDIVRSFDYFNVLLPDDRIDIFDKIF